MMDDLFKLLKENKKPVMENIVTLLSDSDWRYEIEKTGYLEVLFYKGRFVYGSDTFLFYQPEEKTPFAVVNQIYSRPDSEYRVRIEIKYGQITFKLGIVDSYIEKYLRPDKNKHPYFAVSEGLKIAMEKAKEEEVIKAGDSKPVIVSFNYGQNLIQRVISP